MNIFYKFALVMIITYGLNKWHYYFTDHTKIPHAQKNPIHKKTVSFVTTLVER
jgi:hypothetical protein